MTAWNWLQITVGLMLMYGVGFMSGLVAGRALDRREEADDDDAADELDQTPRTPARLRTGEPYIVKLRRDRTLRTPL